MVTTQIKKVGRVLSAFLITGLGYNILASNLQAWGLSALGPLFNTIVVAAVIIYVLFDLAVSLKDSKNNTNPSDIKSKPLTSNSTTINIDRLVIKKPYELVKLLKQMRVGLLMAIALLFLIVLQMILPPLILALQPRERMTAGRFNIAVAQFTQQGVADLPNIHSDVSNMVVNAITTGKATQDNSSPYDVWGPAKVGAISNGLGDITNQSVESLAKEINASVLLYGTISQTLKGWVVIPRLYVNPYAQSQLNEVIDDLTVGSPVEIERAAYERDSRAGQLDLQNRLMQLVGLVDGIQLYSTRNFTDALHLFKELESRWIGDAGMDTLYHLLGNSALSLGDITQAKEYYQKSLQIDPVYARPMISMGQVEYFQAFQSIPIKGDAIDFSNLDILALQERIGVARQWFHSAEVAQRKPPESDIDIKIHYGLARISFLEAQVGLVPDYSNALKEYSNAIDIFESKNTSEFVRSRTVEIVVSCYWRKGFIYWLQGDIKEAMELTKRAQDHIDSYRKFFFAPDLEKKVEQQKSKLETPASTKSQS